MEINERNTATDTFSCIRCRSPAKLQCPKCIALEIPKPFSMFCNQECFTAGWAEHKKVHKSSGNWLYVTNRGRGRTDTLPSFNWTGELRPERIGPYRRIPEGIQLPDYALNGRPDAEIRSRFQRDTVPVWSGKELEGIRRACKLAREVLDKAHAAVAPLVTTDTLDEIVHEATIEAGAYPSPLNYFNFPKSVCTSVNEVICHGIPDCRPLEHGDICNIDVTVCLDGFNGDLNETYVVGDVSPESKNLIKVTHDSLEQAIALVKPGVRYREVGDIISKHAREHGYSVVKTYCGHGIGSLFHCAPSIPHYAKNKAVGTMRPGHVFTIEPMINEGVHGDVSWPDGWTAVTRDGKRSAQFEHTLLVTDSGCEVLTARTSESPPLWWH